MTQFPAKITVFGGKTSSGSGGGAEGAMAPSHIDFMFLGPPYPATGSDAGKRTKCQQGGK